MSSRARSERRQTNNSIVTGGQGASAPKWVRQIDRTYDVTKMRDTLKEALTTKAEGAKIIVASSECMLNKQRRVRPQIAKRSGGERIVKERFGVDEDVCTGDHACIRLSGCPSLSVKKARRSPRDDPVARSKFLRRLRQLRRSRRCRPLCPSFFRAEVTHNSNGWDRFKPRLRMSVIGWLQRRRDRARVAGAEA